jgi:hypothetical protein
MPLLYFWDAGSYVCQKFLVDEKGLRVLWF